MSDVIVFEEQEGGLQTWEGAFMKRWQESFFRITFHKAQRQAEELFSTKPPRGKTCNYSARNCNNNLTMYPRELNSLKKNTAFTNRCTRICKSGLTHQMAKTVFKELCVQYLFNASYCYFLETRGKKRKKLTMFCLSSSAFPLPFTKMMMFLKLQSLRNKGIAKNWSGIIFLQ